MSRPPVIFDDQLNLAAAMPSAVDAIRSALSAHANGRLEAPARSAVHLEPGAYVFTTGHERDRGLSGFRAYNTFTSAHQTEQQIVAVYGPAGELLGVCIGEKLGQLRTGAIGACAVDLLASPEAQTLAVVGAGRQARSQIQGALAVRKLSELRIASRSVESAEKLAEDVTSAADLDVRVCDSVPTACAGANIVILATSSRSPVLEAAVIEPGMHITTVGPKARGASELDPRIGGLATSIVSDSLAQSRAYSRPFFLDPEDHERTIELSAVQVDRLAGRRSPDDVTLFCSVGLAGTEILVAHGVLNSLGQA